MMKKIFITIFILSFFFWLYPQVNAQVRAASLKFDKTTATVDVNSTLTINVTVDPGSDSINSTDAYVTYDATVLEAQSVANGTYFPTVTNNITSGKVYVAGMVDDPASSKTGTGTVAIITFKGLKAGSATLAYDCTNSKIVKNDINATNILTCSENGTTTVTVGSGSSSSSSSSSSSDTTPTPSVLPQTGFFDAVPKYAIPGMFLLLVGFMVRFLIL
jgi:hypothetical protein